MDFMEYLKEQERECIEVIKSDKYNRPVNPADLAEINVRLEKVSAALMLYKAFKERE